MYPITSNAKKYLNEINLSTDNISKNSTSTENAKQIKTQAKTKNINELKEGWKDKPLHGKYPIRASDPDVNSSLTHQWLALSGLKSETEGLIIAAQDQSLPTTNFQANTLENGANSKCWVCDKHTETIDHLVSACPILALTEYLNRDDRLGQYIHGCFCKKVCLPHERNWWEHKPPKVIENKNATILWDFGIHTDRTIQVNRPDIVVKNQNDKTCFLIDMSVPSDTNVSLKIFEKLSKYKDLKIEVTKMWYLKTTLPVAIDVLGIVAKTAPNYVSQIPGDPSLTELQKITPMGTAHTLRKVLSM